MENNNISDLEGERSINNTSLDDELTLDKLFIGKARIRILDILLKHKEINITQIVKMTRLNHHLIMSHLHFFEKVGLIYEIVDERSRVFILNENIPMVEAIINLKRTIHENNSKSNS